MKRELMLKPYIEGFITRKDVHIDSIKIALVGAGQCGNKISVEMVEIGAYGNLLNTAQQDLDDAILRLQPKDKYEFTTMKLIGYEGASKDRHIGKQALTDNAALVKSKLVGDQRIVDADYVLVAAGGGGGTGNASIDIVCRIISSMRMHKRHNIKKNREGKIIDQGKPTIGVILATPEYDAKHKIQLNNAKVLQEIRKLQKDRLLGMLLLIENSKLIEDFLSKTDEEIGNDDWVTNGNRTTAAILAETLAISTMPGEETVDFAEILDLWGTGGCMAIGKVKLKANDFEEMKAKANKYNDPKDEQAIIDTIVHDSFSNNIFASDYNMQTCMHGGMMLLMPDNNKFITKRQSLMFKKSMNTVLDSPMVESPHYGVYTNNTFGTAARPIEKHDEALLYTIAIYNDLPHKTIEITKKALEQEQEALKMKNQVGEDELGSMMAMQQQTHNNMVISESLDDIFGNALGDDAFDISNSVDDILNAGLPGDRGSIVDNLEGFLEDDDEKTS